MGGAEGVVDALVAARKAGNAAQLAQRMHPVAAAGQDLVRVGLMADIPDDAVFRRIERIMQRNRQLDRAEVGRQMAAGLGDRVDDEMAQLPGQRFQLGPRQFAQIRRAVDFVQ